MKVQKVTDDYQVSRGKAIIRDSTNLIVIAIVLILVLFLIVSLHLLPHYVIVPLRWFFIILSSFTAFTGFIGILTGLWEIKHAQYEILIPPFENGTDDKMSLTRSK